MQQLPPEIIRRIGAEVRRTEPLPAGSPFEGDANNSVRRSNQGLQRLRSFALTSKFHYESVKSLLWADLALLERQADGTVISLAATAARLSGEFQLARLISKCPNLNTLFIDTLDVSPTPNCIQPGALDRLTTLRVEQVWGKCSLGTSRVFWLVAKAPSLEHLALGWLRGMVLGACANQKRRCTLKTLTLSCSDSNSEAPIDPAALKWLIDGGEDGRPVPKLILDATGMWSTPEKLGPAWRAALAQVTDVLPALEVVNFGCDFLLLASPNAFAEATVAFASLWTHDDAERPRSRSNDAVLLHRPVHPADLGLSDQREREVEAQTREVWLPGLSGGRALTALKRVDIVQELKYRPLWKRGRTVPSNPAAVLDASWEPFFIRRPGCEPIEVHFKMQLLEFPTDEAAQRALPKYLAVAFC